MKLLAFVRETPEAESRSARPRIGLRTDDGIVDPTDADGTTDLRTRLEPADEEPCAVEHGEAAGLDPLWWQVAS